MLNSMIPYKSNFRSEADHSINCNGCENVLKLQNVAFFDHEMQGAFGINQQSPV